MSQMNKFDDIYGVILIIKLIGLWKWTEYYIELWDPWQIDLGLWEDNIKLDTFALKVCSETLLEEKNKLIF